MSIIGHSAGLCYLSTLAMISLTVCVIKVPAPSTADKTCDTCNCTTYNTEFLRQFIDARVSNSVNVELSANVNTTIESRIAHGIETIIDQTINQSIIERVGYTFAHRPVIKILYLSINNVNETERRVTLKTVSPTTFALGETLSVLDIYNTSRSYTSETLAYYPNLGENSDMPVVFINLDNAIPCFNGRTLNPVCELFTFEGSTFQNGKPFIKGSDSGHEFEIFDDAGGGFDGVETFGFGVWGCVHSDGMCAETDEISLLCLLPRNICAG